MPRRTREPAPAPVLAPVTLVEPFGGMRWRGGRGRERLGWDTRQAIAAAAHRTVAAVRQAERRGHLDVRSLRSVARWIVRALGRVPPQQSLAKAKSDGVAAERAAALGVRRGMAVRQRAPLAAAPPTHAPRLGSVLRGWADAAW